MVVEERIVVEDVFVPAISPFEKKVGIDQWYIALESAVVTHKNKKA